MFVCESLVHLLETIVGQCEIFSIYVSWLMKKYHDCYQSMMKNYRSFRIIYMRSRLHINNKDLQNR